MDASVDEVRGGLTSWLPWRRELDGAARRAHTIARLHAAYHVAPIEYAGAVFALFVFGRTPLLFLRRHTESLFWPVRPLWQEDLVVQCLLGAVLLVMAAIAVRRSNVEILLRQPMLLAFVGFTWLSMAWSVEPDLTMRRSLMLVGSVLVGCYVGERFSLRDQIRMTSWLGWAALATTVPAFVIWNAETRSSANFLREWSGVYVNRNSLGLVLAMGFLATLFFIRTTKRTGLVRTVSVLLFLAFVLTRSRTGLVGVVVAGSVAVVVAALRRRSQNVGTIAAAYVVFAIFATTGLVVHASWNRLLEALGRDPDLTGRTFIWDLARWLARHRPWHGWGFEAIWANRSAISKVQAAHGSLAAADGRGIPGGFPFSAHNGYYELMLGVGYIGLALFAGFLAFAAWRTFRYAWQRRDVESLWPFTFIVFAVVVNFSESLWLASEALLVLTVASVTAVLRFTRPGETTTADVEHPPEAEPIPRDPEPARAAARTGRRPRSAPVTER